MSRLKAFLAWLGNLLGSKPVRLPTPSPASVAPKLKTQQDLWLEKALEITGAYEGKGWGTVTGDFDRQGLSCGVLQWNYGQGSLQAQILTPYLQTYGSIDKLGIFPGPVDLTARMTPADALTYVRQNWLLPNGVPKIEWTVAWGKFLTTPECMEIQKKGASHRGDQAMSLCRDWGMVTPRTFCFFFDVVTQDGGMKGIKKPTPNLDLCKQYIQLGEEHNQKLWATVAIDEEMNVLFQTAYLRAQRTSYVVDVFARKGTIALGLGYVRGTVYSIDFSKL